MHYRKFLFYLPQQLLTETRSVASENAISTSAFIRLSLSRNIRAHRARDMVTVEANESQSSSVEAAPSISRC